MLAIEIKPTDVPQDGTFIHVTGSRGTFVDRFPNRSAAKDCAACGAVWTTLPDGSKAMAHAEDCAYIAALEAADHG